MSQFIGFLAPPGDALSGYDSKQLHHAQAENIPEVFSDAMSVREEVYVEEQKVPLENEFDYDDPRSYHWVAYASVGTSSPQPEVQSHSSSANGQREGTFADHEKQQQEHRRRSSTANKVAIGTIRLVPPPHPPHPEPGSSHKIDNAEAGVPDVEGDRDNHAHNGTEPYVKLGRLAVLKPYRGLGLSNLLVNAALDWASRNKETILPPMSPATTEQRRLELGGAEPDHDWKGLVLVHAQVSVEKVWTRYGFVKDEDMGVWDEEGIDHVGMWKRMELKSERRKSSIV